MIPFSPPRVDELTVNAVAEALRSGWITTGPRTKAFERALEAYTGAERVICLNSWTNAVELVLRWYDFRGIDFVWVLRIKALSAIEWARTWLELPLKKKLIIFITLKEFYDFDIFLHIFQTLVS